MTVGTVGSPTAPFTLTSRREDRRRTLYGDEVLTSGNVAARQATKDGLAVEERRVACVVDANRRRAALVIKPFAS